MKFFPIHEERVAGLPADQHDDDLRALLIDVVEKPEIPEPEFKRGEGVGTEELDRLARLRRLLEESSHSCLNNSLLSGREVTELGLRIGCDRDAVWHRLE
jgi:hypothetical protein